MDFGEPKRKNENLEVTGVSRSGRVRKKSSKLVDFESPDEVEAKYRRKPTFDSTPRIEKPRKSPKISKGRFDEESDSGYNQLYGGPSVARDSDSEPETYRPEEAEDSYEEEEDIHDDDDDDDYLEGQLVVDEKAPTQSLYMMEKSKRKMTIKDGKIVATPKSQRKDKGKSRFTAYMVWAKEVRQELSKQFPDMDFTTMARRLSELWATVPTSEREHWKRKAKKEGLKKAKSKSDAPLMPSRKFINKKGGPIAPLHNSQPVLPIKPPVHSQADLTPTKSSPVKTTEASSPVAPHGVSPTAPIMVAAHLKLMGESLSIIGERLQEHEGQIAVSGSLSVLLDSLLCTVGPLLCLTQHVDEIALDPELLTRILGNVAYIMPGLG